jgi:hypothetical protein
MEYAVGVCIDGDDGEAMAASGRYEVRAVAH